MSQFMVSSFSTTQTLEICNSSVHKIEQDCISWKEIPREFELRKLSHKGVVSLALPLVNTFCTCLVLKGHYTYIIGMFSFAVNHTNLFGKLNLALQPLCVFNFFSFLF